MNPSCFIAMPVNKSISTLTVEQSTWTEMFGDQSDQFWCARRRGRFNFWANFWAFDCFEIELLIPFWAIVFIENFSTIIFNSNISIRPSPFDHLHSNIRHVSKHLGRTKETALLPRLPEHQLGEVRFESESEQGVLGHRASAGRSRLSAAGAKWKDTWLCRWNRGEVEGGHL